MSDVRSAELWAAVRERNERVGNTRGALYGEGQGECLLGSLENVQGTAREKRQAAKDFRRVVGAQPARVNDFSRSTEATYAEVDKAIEKLSIAPTRTHLALPVSSPRMPAWTVGNREMEAVR